MIIELEHDIVERNEFNDTRLWLFQEWTHLSSQEIDIAIRE